VTNSIHESWCDTVTYATGLTPARNCGDSPICNCGVMGPRRGHWGPHRDKVHDCSGGWAKFLSRLDLSYWPETERSMLRGQDGWAFNVAMRFQTIAHDLAQEDPPYYWSSYYLLARIIEKTCHDMTMLEAVEAIAIAFMAGSLHYHDVIRQLKQMEIWP